MKTTKGKLRNITTGILHTEIGDVYEFFTDYLGMDGIMTHQLGSACKALTPILREKLSDEWFTDVWEKGSVNEPAEVPDLTDDEKEKFRESYKVYATELWNSIKDKTIIVTT